MCFPFQNTMFVVTSVTAINMACQTGQKKKNPAFKYNFLKKKLPNSAETCHRDSGAQVAG